MNRDGVMRRTLQVTTYLNFAAALAFAFPGSLGQIMALPVPVPRLYSIFIALLVALFGATYGWLARQPQIDRPLVAFSALGKSTFFLVVLLCWILGDVPGRSVIAAAGDLVFAGIFVWWLLSEAPGAAAVSATRS